MTLPRMRFAKQTSALLLLAALAALFGSNNQVLADHHHHGHSHDDGDHHHGHSHGGGGDEEEGAAVKASAVIEDRLLHPEIPQDLLQRLDFVETFQDGPVALEKGRWAKSQNERYFASEWIIASSFSVNEDGSDKRETAFKDEKSLAVHVKHKHYGLTHVLEQPFDNTGKALVFQYEIRVHDKIGCSGAYAKLLLKQDGFDPLALEEATPYVIMFGPDMCGATNKVHFIVRQKMLDGKWEEKHMTKHVPGFTGDNFSHLYTLIIRPDNSFQILINNREEAKGNLLSATDFSPAFGAPEEIDDPADKKPADWVDEKEIPDPNATKPDDWDEDAPQTIPDPDAKRPEGWDDDEDGEWAAPHIPNPEYKGKWTAPIIPNPAYKGEWKPRRIKNPNYFEDPHPSNLAPIGAISFEILANERGIAFDNIILTHDEEAARKFADLTFKPKQEWEMAYDEKLQREKKREERQRALKEDGITGVVTYAVGEVVEFVETNAIAVAVTGTVMAAAYLFYFFRFDKDEETKDTDEKKKADDGFSPPSSPETSEKKSAVAETDDKKEPEQKRDD